MINDFLKGIGTFLPAAQRKGQAKTRLGTESAEEKAAKQAMIDAQKAHEGKLAQLAGVKFNEPAKRKVSNNEMIALGLGELLKQLTSRVPASQRGGPQLIDQFQAMNEQERQRLLEAESRRVENERNTLMANVRASESALQGARNVYDFERDDVTAANRDYQREQDRFDALPLQQLQMRQGEQQLKRGAQDMAINAQQLEQNDLALKKMRDPMGWMKAEKARLIAGGMKPEVADGYVFGDIYKSINDAKASANNAASSKLMLDNYKSDREFDRWYKRQSLARSGGSAQSMFASPEFKLWEKQTDADMDGLKTRIGALRTKIDNGNFDLSMYPDSEPEDAGDKAKLRATRAQLPGWKEQGRRLNAELQLKAFDANRVAGIEIYPTFLHPDQVNWTRQWLASGMRYDDFARQNPDPSVFNQTQTKG